MPIKSGFCELYPHFNKNRRLPFGADQVIVTPGMVKISKSKSKDIQTFFDMPQIDLDAIFKEVKADVAAGVINHKLKDNDSIAGEFNTLAKEMYDVGLTAPSTRYYTETKLIFYFWKSGCTEEETYAKIERWYMDGKTNGFSTEWAHDTAGVLRRLRHHIQTYYAWLRGQGYVPVSELDGTIDVTAVLSHSDIRRIFEISQTDLRYGEWLFDLLLYAKQRRVCKDYLFLSHNTMRRDFKNGDRQYAKYRDRAIKDGLLMLKDQYRHYRRSTKSTLLDRLWSCAYAGYFRRNR